ncbi:MAG: acyltransferase [Polyangiaceae bacterium]|nr:acyltransferase [Polyangiaceae bacterium]
MSTKLHRSHGSGAFTPQQFRALGEDCVFEAGVLVFHPENIVLGRNVYVGHNAILKGYHKGLMEIGDQTWIGQQCFFHSAGGLTIGQRVGIGPGVRIITSVHSEVGVETPVLFSPVEFAPVVVEDDSDIGVGTVVLPGSRIGKGAIIGANSLVKGEIPPFAIAAGSPARILRFRGQPSTPQEAR